MSSPAARNALQRNLAGRRLGRYEVLTQLASGGMAAVYVARAQGLAGFERLVAIKVLHPHLAYEEEFISMFLDEARLAARIRHPNVVATLDINDTGGDGYFLVMDYIEGDHLGALLQRAGKAGERLPISVSTRVLVDALTGLSAAHSLTDERGQPLHLVHRDVSPHNIMVGLDGVARLTDFGVAKAEVRLSSTREGKFKGKLAYMAPEQASSGEADQRSDLFSMGILLWECLAGRRLFRGKNNAETLHKILEAPIPAPSSVVAEAAPFDAVVARALARAPDERYQSADELAEAIETAAQEVGGLATTRMVGESVRRLAGDQLEEQRARVREAIDTLGHAAVGETHMPLPRDGSGSQVSRRADASQRVAVGEDDTVAARPSNRPAPASSARARWLGLGAIALGALLTALLVVWWAGPWFDDASEGTRRPSEETQPGARGGNRRGESDHPDDGRGAREAFAPPSVASQTPSVEPEPAESSEVLGDDSPRSDEDPAPPKAAAGAGALPEGQPGAVVQKRSGSDVAPGRSGEADDGRTSAGDERGAPRPSPTPRTGSDPKPAATGGPSRGEPNVSVAEPKATEERSPDDATPEAADDRAADDLLVNPYRR